MVDPKPEVPLYKQVDLSRAQSFITRARIVSRAHRVKYRLSRKKRNELDIDVSSHLENVSGLVTKYLYDENDWENADGTHFVFNMDNGRI